MMTSGIATIGYGDRAFDAEQYLHQILDVNTHALIVDTRAHPTCSWSPLWQRLSLADRYGKHYCWRGDLLGNVNHHTGNPIRLAQAERGITWLITVLEQGSTPILLCGCANYETCHRRVIYDQVKARLGDLLPEWESGQRVRTVHSVGTIDPHVPREVHRGRNRYAVLHDPRISQRYFFPHELQPVLSVEPLSPKGGGTHATSTFAP